ncbi:response regulator [Flavobacteriales bacterium]|nr:response regulator [Flavobacteriales bacterium]
MEEQNKILVIEDEPGLRMTLSDLLEINGYAVSTAKDGLDGFNSILEFNPHLVICDINMPKMNGYEVLSSINKRMSEELMPAFLFLTARVQLEDIKQGLKLGADDYILKPFVSTDLLASIEMRLKKRRALINYSANNKEATTEAPNRLNNVVVNEKIGIPVGEGIRFVKLSEVVKCEAERAYCNFYLANGEKILVSKPMKEFEEELERSGFMRVHKSFIVNMNCVDTYVRGKGGYLVLTDGSNVAVSARKKEAVLLALQAN